MRDQEGLPTICLGQGGLGIKQPWHWVWPGIHEAEPGHVAPGHVAAVASGNPSDHNMEGHASDKTRTTRPWQWCPWRQRVELTDVSDTKAKTGHVADRPCSVVRRFVESDDEDTIPV